MNHSPFWPLVWKEYRAGRAFWLAMAAIGLAAQATAVVLTHPAGGPIAFGGFMAWRLR